jgi:(p)ppGpp synthase/HD superfamily hydrolase
MRKYHHRDVPSNPKKEDFLLFLQEFFPFNSADYLRCVAAEAIAEKAFVDVRRENGFKYVVHLRRVAMHALVAMVKTGTVEANSVIVALLHDNIEDFPGQGWFRRIWGQFGLDVAVGVWWCSKPAKIWFFNNKTMRDRVFHLKLRLAPRRILLVKIFDRIDNLGDMWLEYHTIEYQRQKIAETTAVYFQLAKRNNMAYITLGKVIVIATKKVERYSQRKT